jgi:hypothetical protein
MLGMLVHLVGADLHLERLVLGPTTAVWSDL